MQLNLRELRLKAGLSQKQVTDELGLTSSQYLSNAERSKCSISPFYFKKLARLYKVEPELFMNAHMARLEKMARAEMKRGRA